MTEKERERRGEEERETGKEKRGEERGPALKKLLLCGKSQPVPVGREKEERLNIKITMSTPCTLLISPEWDQTHAPGDSLQFVSVCVCVCIC